MEIEDRELEQLRKDAARYRWLRESGPGVDNYWVAHGIIGCLSHWKAEHLDAAIDEAIQNAKTCD